VDLKTKIRKKFLALRLQLTAEQRKIKSRAIARFFLQIPSLQHVKTIAIYLDIKDKAEVETRFLIKKLLQGGKKVAIPKVTFKKKKMSFYEIKDLRCGLKKNAWGLTEPEPMALKLLPLRNIDMVIVPGIAFNFEGFRVGYGAGFYDRCLSKIGKKCLKIGFAFDQQLLHSKFSATHDRALDGLITESQIYCFVKKRAKTHKLLT
jgi:5-formyltetrahydrofolate cyclo-ligase